MKIRVKKLKYEGDFGGSGQTHIVYVLDNSNRPILAEMCNEYEVPIYINKFQKKFDIENDKIIYS
jgi:hypothetical protein